MENDLPGAEGVPAAAAGTMGAEGVLATCGAAVGAGAMGAAAAALPLPAETKVWRQTINEAPNNTVFIQFLHSLFCGQPKQSLRHIAVSSICSMFGSYSTSELASSTNLHGGQELGQARRDIRRTGPLGEHVGARLEHVVAQQRVGAGLRAAEGAA